MEAILLDEALKKIAKEVFPFIIEIERQFEEEGESVLELMTKFNEKDFITDHLDFFRQSLGFTYIEVIVDNTKTTPGKPKIAFQKRNVLN